MHRKNRGAKGPRPMQTQPRGGQAKQKDKAAKGKGEAHQTAPGRPPRPNRPGNRQHQPPSGWTSARPEGTQPLPATNSRRPDERVRAWRVPNPYRLRTAAVRMDECAPGGYPAPTGYEQPPSAWTNERPAATPHTSNTARATHSTTQRASTPVNRSQEAQDTAHTTQHTQRAHR